MSAVAAESKRISLTKRASFAIVAAAIGALAGTSQTLVAHASTTTTKLSTAVFAQEPITAVTGQASTYKVFVVLPKQSPLPGGAAWIRNLGNGTLLGYVPLKDGSCTNESNGGMECSVSFQYTWKASGKYSLRAAYSGDATYSWSSANFTQTVKAFTSVSSTVFQALSVGQSVGYEAVAHFAQQTPAPTGSVTFSNQFGTIGQGTWNPATDCAPESNGSLDCIAHVLNGYAWPSPGIFQVSVTYSGDANYMPSFNAAMQQVTGWTSVGIQQLNQAFAGQYTYYQVDVRTAGNSLQFSPTGEIQLIDWSRGGLTVAAGSLNGSCSFNGAFTDCTTQIATVWNPAGVHQAMVTYSGDTFHSGSSAQFSAYAS